MFLTQNLDHVSSRIFQCIIWVGSIVQNLKFYNMCDQFIFDKFTIHFKYLGSYR